VPALAAAVCIAALDALATGALHLDGLSDMADGFGGGHTRDDVLRIMRDHQIGAYGATALVLVLLLRIAAWQELIATHTLWPLLLAPCAGRWATVCLSWRGPYARPSGTGAVSRYVGRLEIALATLTGLAAAFGLGQWRGLLLCLPVPVCAGVVLLWARRRIGGVTGDVIGAATIVSESLVLLLAVARW
jgi:cobalamin 5'-phosphate synthase/cobalamin synthase